jgi:capsular exopolysaccharide synthesis family protein
MSQFFEAMARSERERTAKVLPHKLHVLPDPSPASAEVVPESTGNLFELRQVPAEKVDVTSASHIALHTDRNIVWVDRFRYLRMRLKVLWNLGKLRSLLITSPLPQDGKSTVALSLATTLAEGGKSTVLLIEADLYCPSIAKQLGLEAWPGLAECLEGKLRPLSALRRIEPLGWYLLQAGQPIRVAADLFHSDALSLLMNELSPHFDWILIDAPPVIPLTDALLLAAHVNATLLVVRESRTPRESIEETISLLGQERVLGIVLNGSERLDRKYAGYKAYK